jgi:Surface glycan-binding protein B xyloglucan binding domain/IPT/TIG domain
MNMIKLNNIKMKNIFSLLNTFALACLLMVAFSCEEKEVSPQISIAEVFPTEGLPGGLVTIKGAKMNNLQKVLFGDVDAFFNPTYNTDGVLLVRIPEKSNFGSQKITLINKGGEATQATFDFKVIPPPPSITAFEPLTALPGDKVTITGKNFYEVTEVLVGSTVVKLDSKTPTSIVFTVPETSLDGKISVKALGGAIESNQAFSSEKVLAYVANFDGAGLRDDYRFWYYYGSIAQTDKPEVAISKANPDPISGNFLKINNASAADWWVGGTENWDWDTDKFLNFGIKNTNPETVGIKFDLNSNGATQTVISVILAERNGKAKDFSKSVKVDWAGWKTVTLRLSDFAYDGNGANLEKVDPSKVKSFKIHLIEGVVGKRSEANFDNIRFVELK